MLLGFPCLFDVGPTGNLRGVRLDNGIAPLSLSATKARFSVAPFRASRCLGARRRWDARPKNSTAGEGPHGA
jgi:hypothetical protein